MKCCFWGAANDLFLVLGVHCVIQLVILNVTFRYKFYFKNFAEPLQFIDVKPLSSNPLGNEKHHIWWVAFSSPGIALFGRGHRKLIGGLLLVCSDGLAPPNRWPISFSLVSVHEYSTCSLSQASICKASDRNSPDVPPAWAMVALSVSELLIHCECARARVCLCMFFSLSPTLLSIEILWVTEWSETGPV